MKKTKTKFGAIAILDALGVSNYTIEQSIEYVKKIKQLHKTILQTSSFIAEKIEVKRDTFIAHFGDTVLFAIEEDANDQMKALRTMGLLVQNYFCEALQNDLLLRGSISFGSYMLDKKKNIVLGPAVSDAAAWYNAANWAGIIATPRTTLKYKMDDLHLGDLNPTKESASPLISYNVPMKDGKTMELMALNWPKKYAISFPKAEKELLRRLTNFSIPRGTEAKYQNTVNFLKHSVDIKDKSATAV